MANEVFSFMVPGITDYRENYPPQQAEAMQSRGGNFKTKPSQGDINHALTFLEDSYSLLTNPDIGGFAVFRQVEGYSEQGQAVRDELLLALGSVAGFDVEGVMNENEVDDVSLPLADQDIDELGIDPEHKGHPVLLSYRQARFGNVATKRDFVVTEFEIPNKVITIGEDNTKTVEDRFMRIINLQIA